MSESFLSLIVFGLLVVAGVVLFNWWQDRAERRRRLAGFSAPAPDPAPPPEPLAHPGGAFADERTDPEPRVAMTSPADTTPVTASPQVLAVERAAVDCVAEWTGGAPLGRTFHEDLQRGLSRLGRPTQVAGFDERRGQWVEVEDQAAGRFARVRLSVLLADRRGTFGTEDYDALAAMAGSLADAHGLGYAVSDRVGVESRVHELDRFFNDVDIAIGLSVVSAPGTSLDGPRLRRLAEEAGLVLEPDGQYHCQDPGGRTLFTCGSMDRLEPFDAGEPRGGGITFLLDVPRAPDTVRTLERMVEQVRRFAHELGGTVRDEAGKPIGEGELGALRSFVARTCERMDEAGIPAGSTAALRVFAP